MSAVRDSFAVLQCALSFLVSRAPSLGVTPRALQELDKVLHLFKEASKHVPRVSSYYVSPPALLFRCPRSSPAQAILDKVVARGREHYVNWRNGTRPTHDDSVDEICLLVRRIAPPTGDGFSPADTTVTDPFEHAHAYLRRCLEQATAADPCTPTGFHLTRIRGPVGSILHAQSDVRSYSAPGELSPARPVRSTSWSSGRVGYAGDASYASPNSTAALGADIPDCTWMSWL